MNIKVVIGIVLTTLVVGIHSGWSETPSGAEKVSAVQNRVFHRSHELDFSVGYIADDDFFHVYPIGLGYTFHFNEELAWEVARVQYMFNTDKDLKSTLRDDFNVQPELFPEKQYMLHSHIVYKPLYGKHAFLNRGVINNEISLFAGPGVVNYKWDYSTGETSTENALSISFGAGMKFFLSERWCLNAEVRDLINFREDETENNVYFGLGIGFRFDLAPRKIKEDPTMNKLKRILNDD